MYREKGRVIGIPNPALQLKSQVTRHKRAKASRKVGGGGNGQQDNPRTESMKGAARSLRYYLIHTSQAAFRETRFSFISFPSHH